MPTAREPRIADNANRESNLGVRLLKPRLGRPNPFGVQWGERAWDDALQRDRRKVRTEFFPTEKAAGARARELRDARREGAGRLPTRREIEDWRAFQAACEGTPWTLVVAGWRSHLHATGLTPCRTTVAEHAKHYMAELKRRVDDGGCALGTFRHHKNKVKLFAEQFGHLTLGQVQPDDIRKWLDGLGLGVASTWNNYRKIVSVFFSTAVEARSIAENPCQRVAVRAIVSEEGGILTVPQIAQLLHTAMSAIDAAGRPKFRRILWRLSLEIFAGVRFSSACRLLDADVNQTDKGIRHTARSIKTRKRQYIEGYPDVLWAWLAIEKADAELTERQYLEAKSELFRVARVPHPHNCLRHSFATYHLAARTNPGLTAYLLCHRNQQKLWEHYKGNATAAEGKRFETLMPGEVAQIAREWEMQLELLARQPAGLRPTPA